MKILLCSVPFSPSVGGIETVSALLAEEFRRAGHEVVLVTRTAAAGPQDVAGFPIVRVPGGRELLRWHRWADVVLHNNLSLRFAWALLVVPRPWIVAHHTWIPSSGAVALTGILKRLALRAARNLAVSDALAASLPVPAEVIPNPYAHTVFRRLADTPRDGDLVFVGRLVSDKGASLLLHALRLLHLRGLPLRLTIVGDGPERPALRELAEDLGVARSLHFAGTHRGESLVRLLNSHRLCVVPSIWEEPFGLVALEALACGCVPVVARSGGLPAAVGSCGAVVAPGDPVTLADALQSLHGDPARRAALLAGADQHLAMHRPAAVARRYLEVLHSGRRRDRIARPA